MSWAHVSGTGAQVSSASQVTLSATFPGTIAAGDLIVVSIAWFGSYLPSVQDSVNSTGYTYVGPSQSATQQAGTWYYVAASGGSSFQVTATGNGTASYMAMTIDSYTFTSGYGIAVDSNAYATGTSATPVIPSSLSVSSSDLIYAACIANGASGTVTAGTGFALRYTAQIIGGTTYGIAAEDYVNESSAIAPGLGFANSTGWGINAIAFKAAVYTATLSGPQSGGLGISAQFTVSLNMPAPSGGQVVGFASTQGSDVFKDLLGGSVISSITIPANSISGTFWLIPSSVTGNRNITFTASGTTLAYEYGGSYITYYQGSVAGQYLLDTFAGTAGTLLTSHISDSGSAWPNDPGHVYGTTPLQLDGNGMVFSSVLNPNCQISSASMPTGNIEINFTLKDYGGYSSGSVIGGVMIYTNTPLAYSSNFLFLGFVTQYGTSWFSNGFTGANAPGFSGTFRTAIGTLYHIKMRIFSAYGTSTIYYYYSTDGTTWNNPGALSTKSISTPSYPVSIGPAFNTGNNNSTPATATTGIHIGDITVGSVVMPSPTSVVSLAYVATSGESVVVFFNNSVGTGVAPQFLLSVPTIYKNGTSVGDLSNAVPWINSSSLPVIFPLPAPVLSTDVITMSAPASWMLLSDQSTVSSISSFAVTNNVGKSCFGTDTLTRTLKVGVNISSVGCYLASSDSGQAFNNLAVRCNFPGAALPTNLVSTTQSYAFMSTSSVGSNIASSFGTPEPLGYYAIGYDDNYVANGGSPTPQLKITSHQLPTVVTQVASCNNTGTNGIGQYYLFQVTSTGVDSSSHPSFGVYLDLTYPSGSGNTYVSNLFILAPGEFTFTLGTPLTFDRSTPLVVSNSFKAALPSGVGSMRFADAFNYIVPAVDPWECRAEHDASWNTNKFSSALTITQLRPFVTSVSPYMYGDFIGSSWTAVSSPLSSEMTISQTTITMTYAQTECYVSGAVGPGQVGNPLFYGLTLAVGGQGGAGTLEYMRIKSVLGTSVTVVRGWAFNGVLTPAVAHGTGENITIGNRYSWGTLANLGSFFGGSGHQTYEVVCSSPHQLHSGQRVSSIPWASSYPVNDTNGNQLKGVDIPIAMVTGPNTFVSSVWSSSYNAYPGATLNTQYNLPTPINFTFGLPSGQMPYEAACVLTNQYNCNMHANLPMLASDGFIYQKAQMFLSKLTPGRELVIEMGDEPGNYYWIQWVEAAFSAILNGSGGNYFPFWWYCTRVNQVNNIFYSVFNAAGRGNEIKRFVNCAGNNGIMSTAQSYSPPIKVDYMGVAPYASSDFSGNQTSTVAFDNNATLNQIADLFIHQIYYLSGTAVNSGIVANEFQSYNSVMSAYNTATGYNCHIYGYEGGYSSGCSTGSFGPLGNNGWYNWRVASDIRYLPLWRIYEKDFYAMCQNGGYTTLNLYSMYLYPFYQSEWIIYSNIGQIPGLGDGTDGKFDNRKALLTSGLSGPIYYTAGYLGVGSGTVHVTNGGTTVTFSNAWTITPGLSWITINGDPKLDQYFLASGSGLGPWTIYTGVNPPGNNTYEGPTNLAATYVYGIATNQDANTVSVRGQALAEWNSTGGVVANNNVLQLATGVG